MKTFTIIWLASSLLTATLDDVEIVVRDPGGEPVANRTARVVEATLYPSHSREAPRTQVVRTDAKGRARLSVGAGLRPLNIRVPGIGFGGTGIFEVRDGQVARPELPRLARFARVEGKVDSSLFRPGMRVEGTHSKLSGHDPDNVSALCDADGRFVFAEVVPGELQLLLFQDRRRVPMESMVLLTEPGQTRRDVVLVPPRPPDPDQERRWKEAVDFPNWTKEEEITWVEGTVRDTRGAPVEGAELLVKGVYYPGMRNYSEVRTGRTDARGHYRIRGPHVNFQESLTVVVRSPGRAPILAYASGPGRDDTGPRAPLDLTVPDRGGALAVRVLKDGKPAPNVFVALHEQGLVEREWGRASGDMQAFNALHKIFHPIERTGAGGLARFQDLYPCFYQLRTSEDGGALDEAPFPHAGNGVRAVVPSVAIAAGATLSMTLALHREDNSATLQALRPDGTPPGHRGVTFSVGLCNASASAIRPFDDGVGTFCFSDRGLWAVRVQFRETESPELPANYEPFYRGELFLPVSPAYPLGSPVKIACDLHRPGSIRARLVGPDGKPARGTILIIAASGPDLGAIDRAASTDEAGVAVFTDLASGAYRIRGSMEAYPPAYLAMGDGPLPEDATLRDQVAFPAEEVKVEPGTEARVQLRPVRAAYVRGRVKPAPGGKASDYDVSCPHDWLTLPGFTRRDAAGGEYLCGPLPPGKFEVRLHGTPSGQSYQNISHPVTVTPGEVAHLDLEATGEPARPGRPAQAVSLGMGGLITMEPPPEAMAGTVVHWDGRAPAFGARAVLLVPKESRPTSLAISDAAGRLMWTRLWIPRGQSTAAPNPPGQVTTPTVVVSLPGLAGASVIPIEPGNTRPFRAVLPPPLNATGRVTLGGRPITSQGARVRVIAGHQGSGVLDGPLSVEGTVHDDGRFTLRGLTPGTYRVQAARDGIWLSRSATLRISPDEKPGGELSLDIPEPGAAVTFALVDDGHRPAGRRRLKLARPEGPLMALWPESFTTGADGTMTVRGLEVGAHQLLIEGEDAPRTFEIPDLGRAPARLVYTIKASPR
jgi:hypothetical protein